MTIVRRDCAKVIDEIITKIPADKTTFISALKHNRNSAQYKAPEETIQWDMLAETLYKFIPKPITDWEFEVVSIFSTISIEDLRKKYK